MGDGIEGGCGWLRVEEGEQEKRVVLVGCLPPSHVGFRMLAEVRTAEMGCSFDFSLVRRCPEKTEGLVSRETEELVARGGAADANLSCGVAWSLIRGVMPRGLRSSSVDFEGPILRTTWRSCHRYWATIRL